MIHNARRWVPLSSHLGSINDKDVTTVYKELTYFIANIYFYHYTTMHRYINKHLSVWLPL